MNFLPVIGNDRIEWFGWHTYLLDKRTIKLLHKLTKKRMNTFFVLNKILF
jgi:hypothetical protein